MTGIRILLEEVADEARVYAVVASAKAGGRRRRRVRRIVAAGSAAVAVLGVAAATYIGLGRDSGTIPDVVVASPSPTESGLAFPTSCTVELLPTPDGYPPKATVTGMDPTGRFILGRAYPGDGRPNVLVWDNGVVAAAHMPGSEPTLTDVNTAGIAVGYTVYADDTFQAFFYRDGVLTKLADRASAFQINEAGAILGQLGHGTTWQPVVWPSASAQPVTLELPSDLPIAIPVQLFDDGTVIGYATDLTGNVGVRRPVLWHPDGSRVDLQWPALPGPDGKPLSVYRLDPGRGDWAVVEAYSEQTTFRATYVWNVRTGETRPLAQAADLVGARAWSIERGGGSDDSLVSEHRSLTLPRLAGAEHDGVDTRGITLRVTAISDDGRVIGGYVTDINATFGYDDMRPLAWRCE